MSLEPVIVPEVVKGAINQLELFLSPGDPSPRDQGQQRYWQKVVTLGLQDLKEDKGPKDAKRTAKLSWRYLIGIRSGDALYATVNWENKMTGLSRGPEATVAFQAAQELRTLPEAAEKDKDYDPWVLTIPGLLTECFWLELKRGEGGDLVVPFFTSQALRRGNAYRLDKFLEIIRPLAEKRLEAEEDAKEPQADGTKFAEWCRKAQQRIDEEHNARLRTEGRRLMAEERRKKEQDRVASARQKVRNEAIQPPRQLDAE
jgi:hypothetical protein